MTSQKQTSGQEDSPAKTSALQESEQALPESDPALPSPSLTLWSSDDLGGSCWKMSLVSSVPTAALTSEGFSMRWSNSGMAYRGELWTLDTSESPNDGVECSLSQVLNPTAPVRFSLSAKAASGILRRAGRRGKVLPPSLEEALTKVASGRAIGELFRQEVITGKEVKFAIRRLTPTECERLMGWPDGWTISKAWTHSAQKRTAPSKPETGKQE